ADREAPDRGPQAQTKPEPDAEDRRHAETQDPERRLRPMKTTPIAILRCAALGLALVVSASTAAAGPESGATSAALFQAAKKLAAAGDYEHALPKFLEAQRLLPTPGTLLNIGDCFEKLGKLASAWGAFKEAEVMARAQSDSVREQEAQNRS